MPTSFSRADRLTTRVATSVVFLVVVSLVPAGYFAARHHHQEGLEVQQETVRALGELMRIGLESQMRRHKGGDALSSFVTKMAQAAQVSRVLVFDRDGALRHSSGAVDPNRKYDAERSAMCRICHDRPASQRAQSVIVRLDKGRTIRQAIPLYNSPHCHGCHDKKYRLNGVIVMDVRAGRARERLLMDLLGIAVGTFVLCLILLVGTRFIFHRQVLAPLEGLAKAAAAIASGDLSRRVEVAEHDNSAIDRLGAEFNRMASSLTGLMSNLAQRRAQLENVINSVDDGLVVVDRELSVVAINRALAERLDRTRDELVGQSWTELRQHLLGSEELTEQQRLAERCFASGALEKLLHRHTGETGHDREHEVYATPIKAGVEVTQVVEIWRDTTDRKAFEAKMAQFERLTSLGMLAAGFSHEMNTPLGTILICADGVRRTLSGDRPFDDKAKERTRTQMEVIRNEIERCQQLTKQFLSISRGGKSPRQELLDLAAVAESVVPLVRPAAAKAGVSVELEVEQSATVKANIGAVQQVLLNLIMNAVGVLEDGGHVTVTCKAAPEPKIVVTDDGPGIAPEMLDRIFEPFFSARKDGTGLGLFVSANLARGWGGSIEASSTPRQGATFEVLFPASSEAPDAPDKEPDANNA